MRLWLALVVACLAGCDVNPFDPAQQPVVAVSVADGAPRIDWAPEGARLVRVYRGATTGDGYGDALMWSVAAADGRNGIGAPLRYGVVPPGADEDWPARPLVSGTVYTAEVTRRDPRGRGDGFTSTSNRYVGTATFTAP